MICTALFLLIGIALGVTFFPNSTISPESTASLSATNIQVPICQPGVPYLTAFSNPYETITFPSNPSRASLCSSDWTQQILQYISTADVSTGLVYSETIVTTINGQISALVSSATQEMFVGPEFAYTVSTPCCLQCTLFGGTVQVFYWPTPAPSPPVTALVNTAGYTL